MSKKTDDFYFSNFLEAAECACASARYLEQCMESYDLANIEKMLDVMHTHEHRGDEVRHEMSVALIKAFITPIDREDLDELSGKIDEVTDTIEEVLQRFYVAQVRTSSPEALEFSKKLCSLCESMKDMLAELPNFKKSARLRELIVELNRGEEECDRFYLRATMQTRSRYSDVLDVISWREIFDYMERSADACEHVADTVETIVMKNT